MLSRRTFLGASLAVSSSFAAGSAFSAVADHEPPLRYWDNHAGFGYTGPQDIKLVDVWRAAGVHDLSINVGFDLVPWSTTFLAIANYTRAFEARPDLALCSTLAEVLAAWQAGEMAPTFDIEGMGALNGELALVETVYRLGVRQMAIAYNVNNDAGGGCHDDDKGLTDGYEDEAVRAIMSGNFMRVAAQVWAG